MLVILFAIASILISSYLSLDASPGIIFIIPNAILIFIAINVLYIVFLYITSLTLPNDDNKKYDSPLARKMVYLTMEWILMLSRVNVEINGLEKLPEEKYVFISNHLSKFDPIVAYVFFKNKKLAFISKKENMEIPIAGRYIRMAGFLGIDRDHALKAMRTIRRAADMIINDDYSFGVYPEGTRSKSGELLPFKTGAFVLCQKAKCPLVITSVAGTEKVRHNSPWKSTKVTLDILEVIPTDTVINSTPDELSEAARNVISQNLQRVSEEKTVTTI